MDAEIVILVFGIIGTIAFAISGALIAIERDLDLLGVIIIAVITACGGGVFRDIMLGKGISMFLEPIYPLIATITGSIVFGVMYLIRDMKWEKTRAYKMFYNIIDAIGLGAFVVTGATVPMNLGVINIFPVTFYSVLTGCGGGMLRDICVGKIPAIFRKHIYAIAAIIGALIYYGSVSMRLPLLASILITVFVVVAIRFLAYYFEWSLPKVRLKERNA